MEVEGSNLESIFIGSTFSLPEWQRRYEWEKPNWKGLWKSIISAYSNGGYEYKDIFFGSFLLQKKKDNGSDYHIVDGQQRLITISILLSAIRDLTLEDGDLITNINKLVLIDKSKYNSIIPNERITPFSIDAESFHKIVNNYSIKNNNDLIYECYDYFISCISVNKEKIEYHHLVKSIIKHLLVSKVIMNKNERSGEMFYYLNYNQRPLQPIDILRVTFFGDLDPALYPIYYHKYWESIEKIFGSEPSEFISYLSVIIKYQGIEIENDPLTNLIDNLRDLELNAKIVQVQKILTDIFHLHDIYLFIKNPLKSDLKFCNEIKIRLEFLRYIDAIEAIPLLLHWIELSKLLNNPTPEVKDKFIQLLKLIETLYVRNNIMNNKAEIITKFNDINKLKPESDLNEYFENIKGLIRPSILKNISFYEELINTNLYNNKSICNLIVFALEHHFNKTHAIVWNSSSYTIEHIMPKKLSQNWIDYLGPKSDEIHYNWLNTLGNLALLPNKIQSVVSNKLFDEKRIVYEKCHFGLFDSVTCYNKWTDIEIKKRGEILAQICDKEIWPGFDKDIMIEPLECKDEIKGYYFKDFNQRDGKDFVIKKRDLFYKLVELIHPREPDKLENIINTYPNLFSKKNKGGYSRYFSECNIYLRNSTSCVTIDNNCKILLELIGWDKERWYGIADRTINGINNTIYFGRDSTFQNSDIK